MTVTRAYPPGRPYRSLGPSVTRLVAALSVLGAISALAVAGRPARLELRPVVVRADMANLPAAQAAARR